MALTSYSDIQEQVREIVEQLKESAYPEDLLREHADSECPIYYSDIVNEWRELPNEYCDRWQELGLTHDSSITSLMQTDLFLYYQEQFEKAWEDIKEELEGEE
jgi:hypothetical protein